MSELVRIELRQGTETRDVHLRACLDRASDIGDLVDADVLYFARNVSALDVVGRLAAYPGCVVCAGPTQDGTMLLAVRAGNLGEQVELVASIMHALLAGGTGAVGVGGASEAGVAVRSVRKPGPPAD